MTTSTQDNIARATQIAATAKKRIRHDVEAGRLPGGIATIAELMKHADLRVYVDDSERIEGTNIYGRVVLIVSAWLSGGGLGGFGVEGGEL